MSPESAAELFKGFGFDCIAHYDHVTPSCNVAGAERTYDYAIACGAASLLFTSTKTALDLPGGPA